MAKDPCISVVIPAFNEAEAIERTVEGVRAALGDRVCEIVVVDDGSTDATAELAKRAGARVIRHGTNAGYGRSLKDGIEAAAHDTIVMTDADGTYPLEAIPTLLAEYERGPDMVVGERSGRYYRESGLMVVLRAALKVLVAFAAWRVVPDVNSGLRVFSKSASVPHFAHLCDTFSFTTSLTLAYLLTRRTIAFVPISYHQRIGSRKVRLPADSLRTLGYIARISLRYRPLSSIAKLAGIAFAGALAVAAVIAVAG